MIIRWLLPGMTSWRSELEEARHVWHYARTELRSWVVPLSLAALASTFVFGLLTLRADVLLSSLAIWIPVSVAVSVTEYLWREWIRPYFALLVFVAVALGLAAVLNLVSG